MQTTPNILDERTLPATGRSDDIPPLGQACAGVTAIEPAGPS